MQDIDLNLIDPNPWQPRIGEDHAHIKKIAESIAANGLLQIPSARRRGDRYQLAFGHSRLAAFKFLRDATDRSAEFAAMPLNIVELNDRQMADAAAAENVARKDLSAIEMARGIKRYIDDFGATQIEAGRVFGYSSQSSVSNLLRLLQLPEPVQQQVNEGKLPERYARELITLSRAHADAAVKVAGKYAEFVAGNTAENADADNRASSAFATALDRALDTNGVNFTKAAWQLQWPGKPITIEQPKKDQPSQVPACKGCPFFVDANSEWQRRCLKPACFNLKAELWAQHALEAASKKHGLPILGKGEQGEIVWGGQRDKLPLAVVRKATADKHATLRVGLFVLKKGEHDYRQRERVEHLGYGDVVIMSTNVAALMRDYAEAKRKEKEQKKEHEWERDNRLKREREKRNEQIIKQAAPHLAAGLVVPSALLPALHEMSSGFMSTDERAKWAKCSDAERKANILQRVLEKLIDIHSYNYAPVEAVVIQKIHDLAGDMNMRLPQGWHHEAVAVPVNGKKRK
jgi:ParB/RepB/Spo0J family partition protein